MSMTIAEAKSEIAALFKKADAIEQKYPDGLFTDQQDENEVKRLLTEIDGLEAKLAALQSVEERRERIQSGLANYTQPATRPSHPQAKDVAAAAEAQLVQFGEHFLANGEYKRLQESGFLATNTMPVQFTVPLPAGLSFINYKELQKKALIRAGSDTSGGGFIINDRIPGIVELLQREITVFDLVPRFQTRSDTVEYVKEDTFTNAAAVVAEATATTGTTGLKPESELAYSVATSPVKTVAHWVPVTNRMLADVPQIRGLIDNRLLLGLDLKLSEQILVGDGTGENFTGVINAGILLQTKGTDNELDAIWKARQQVRVTGKARPNAVVMHPNDFTAVRLARENAATGTLGAYLMGPPSQLGPATVWSMPVIEDQGLTENTTLVGDWSMGAGLYDREQSQIRVGLIDDQFVRNMQTILAELRAAFVVFRPSAFCRVTGM